MILYFTLIEYILITFQFFYRFILKRYSKNGRLNYLKKLLLGFGEITESEFPAKVIKVEFLVLKYKRGSDICITSSFLQFFLISHSSHILLIHSLLLFHT